MTLVVDQYVAYDSMVSFYFDNWDSMVNCDAILKECGPILGCPRKIVNG